MHTFPNNPSKRCTNFKHRYKTTAGYGNCRADYRKYELELKKINAPFTELPTFIILTVKAMNDAKLI